MKFDLSQLPDPDTLDTGSLRELYSQLEELYGEIEAQEPEDEESEEYDAWLDDLEELED